MAGVRRSAKRKIPRRTGTRVAAGNATKSTGPGNEVKPVRGVKLKTISMLTMLFALICLAAFMAGRPPHPRQMPACGECFLRTRPTEDR